MAAFSYVLVEVATTDITQVIMMMVTGMEMGAMGITTTMIMRITAMTTAADIMEAEATGIREHRPKYAY